MAVRVARRREESCLDSARSLLSTLQGRPSLANIVKPDWEAKETTSRAVMMLELLDGWLEEGVKEVQAKVGYAMDTISYPQVSKVGGSPDQLASLLSRIGSTVRDFHWDSKDWKDTLGRD